MPKGQTFLYRHHRTNGLYAMLEAHTNGRSCPQNVDHYHQLVFERVERNELRAQTHFYFAGAFM